MNFEDLEYSPDFNELEYEKEASFQQMQFLNILTDSNAMNAFSDREIDVINLTMCDITFADASNLINKILESQPNEIPVSGQGALSKWIKKNIQ